MANVRFAVGLQRLIPFLGYHHVLMILIALAIILLCEFEEEEECAREMTILQLTDFSFFFSNSPLTSRLFLLFPPHTGHLPHHILLRKIHAHIRSHTSQSRRQQRDCKFGQQCGH